MPETTHTLAVVRAENLSNIADAIRWQLDCSDSFAPGEMAAAISSIEQGQAADTGDPDEWTRPAAWPDLDAIPIDYDDDEEVVYMTFDNTHANVPASQCWAGFYAGFTVNGAYAVAERGTVSGGVFTPVTSVQSAAATATSGRYYFSDYYGDSDAPYVVYRITAVGGHLSQLGLGRVDTAATGLSRTLGPHLSPLLERRGCLPYVSALTSSTSTITSAALFSWGSIWLERDSVLVGKRSVVVSLSNAWTQCWRLRSLDLSGWNTSNWEVTSLAYAWAYCVSLRHLDVSGWDTSNWAVTNLQFTWNACHSLLELDLSGWNVSGWEISSSSALSNTWAECRSLRALHVAGWDTRNWAVKSLSGTWSNCMSLTRFDAESWDTSNWSVNTLNSTWANCSSLRELDLSGWSTSNWAVTSLASTWTGCAALRRLDVSKWDTSGWAVTALTSTWNSCYTLVELDIADWDTSGWVVTSIASAWTSCINLRALDLSGWDTGGFVLTNAYRAFSSCRRLRSLKLGALSFSGISSGTGSSNTTNGIVDTTSALEVLDAFSGVTQSVSLAGSYSLTAASVRSVFQSLGTVSNKTITLAANVYDKLSAADLAIATNKGWAVAAG